MEYLAASRGNRKVERDCHQAQLLHREMVRSIHMDNAKAKGLYLSRLIFATPEKVDAIWAALASKFEARGTAWHAYHFAESLISGPLASSSARVAKVSTSPSTEVPHYQHVICLYIPNVYDKEDVTAVRIGFST